MTLKDRMNAIYRNLRGDEIPWNLDEPPSVLVDLIETHEIQPCSAVDLGCGTGHHVLWLATLGFDMTGIDLSGEAVALARRMADERGLSCRFLEANLAESVVDLADCFDLAYDWKVLHHVFPHQRILWAENVRRVLRAGGTYVSVCFSEREPTGFPGSGKFRDTPLGTTLYLSSEDEICELFEPFFSIEQMATIVIPGRSNPHSAVKTVMKRR